MKYLNKKLIYGVVFTLFTVAGFALAADSSSNAINYLPKECNVVGAVNLKTIKTIKSVNDAINQTEQDPIYLSLKASGLSMDNINDIYFGMHINKLEKAKPSFLALIKTEKVSDLKKFVEASAKEGK